MRLEGRALSEPMKRSGSAYEMARLPKARRLVIAGLRVGARRHIMYGLGEIDVTRPRQYIREHKVRTGETLSFTAFIVACLAKAVEANKLLHAYRDWRNRLVLFDEVDVVTMIEAETGEVAIPHIVRAANKKTVREIHDEIRAVQAQPATSAQRSGLLMRLGEHAPGFLLNLFFRLAPKNPHWLKRTSGTVVLTSVGMFAGGGGWGFTILPLHTLGITLGGLVEKPGVVNGRIEIREYLDMTISVDHDIVDGAPGARFVRRLRELIESGFGLEINVWP